MFYVPVNIAILSSEVKNMHKNKLGNKNWLYNMDPLWKVLFWPSIFFYIKEYSTKDLRGALTPEAR